MTSSPARFRVLLALAYAPGLAWAAPARAEPPAVVLHTSTCTPEDDAALRRALEVELEALHVEPRWTSTKAAGAPAPITLSAECDPESGSVSLEVWASDPRLVSSRLVALQDVGAAARARTLALVISEALGPTLARQGDESGLEHLEPPSSPRAATPAADARSSRARRRHATAFSRVNPYGEVSSRELFTTTNPYGMSRSFRIGSGAQARFSLRDRSLLLGAEIGASGPLADALDASVEVSYASATSGLSALDSRWWGVAFGADFVHFDAIGFAAGPRLAFGHLSVTNDDAFAPRATEQTLVSQFGVRSKFELPLDERLSLLLMFGAQHTLGVYALTHYTGLDEGLNGWLLSWSLGLGVEP